MTHVVVIGAGIAGLSAAYELTGGPSAVEGTTVTVLDAERLGGKLLSSAIGGEVVDVGPDGFLARRPEAVALVGELGADTELEPVGTQGAWVFTRGRLRRLPQGLALGVPTRLKDLRSRDVVGLLGVGGALRAGRDLVAPRPARRSALSDRAIGPLVADKLGQRVVDVLVDPLVGGIHAGRVKDLSAAAVYPSLLSAGQRRGSLMRSLRADSSGAAATADGPAFFTLHHGVGDLPRILEKVLVDRGVDCRAGCAVTSLHRGRAGEQRWSVEHQDGSLTADAVVIATPPPATSTLLGPLDADAASLVATIDAAGVAVITLEFDAESCSLPDGTGLLVPSGTPRGEATFLTSAVTFLDRKWPHLARDGRVLLRASSGRIDDRRWEELDDAAIVTRVCEELHDLLGVTTSPTASLVTRWPASFPQYRVNHLVRVDGIEAAASALGGVAVAGAAYRGVGIPACIASGRAAARQVRNWLAQS